MAFFKRCLAGQEKLWKAFWVMGIVVWALSALIMAFLSGMLPGIVVALIILALNVVWVLGVWRCASNAKWKGWKLIARILALISGLGLAAQALNMAGIDTPQAPGVLGDIPSMQEMAPDVSGGVGSLIDQGAGALQAAGDAATDAAGAVVDAGSDAASAVGDAAGDAVNAVGDAASDAGNAIGDAATGAVDAVQDGAAAVTEGAGDLVEGAADAASDAGNAVGDAATGAVPAVVAEAASASADISSDVAAGCGEKFDAEYTKAGLNPAAYADKRAEYVGFCAKAAQ